MVAFGCCLSVSTFVPQMAADQVTSVGVLEQVREGLTTIRQSQYDFAELTVGTLVQLSDEEFSQLRQLIEQSAIDVRAVNSFIPSTLRLTGPEVSIEAVERYVEHAIARVKAIGARSIIFGSGGSRSVPEGFPMDQAALQLQQFLTICERYAAQNDLVIAIEPLNRRETNIINTVAEAIELAKVVQLPHIKVLADAYHMRMENESFDVLKQAGDWLDHVHIANRDRFYPGRPVQEDVDYTSLLSTLRDIDYTRGVSWECRFDHFANDSRASLEYIKTIWSSLP